MAGKFVSAGTLDKPTERDNAWLQAEQELEDRRAEKERNKAAHDGKTLFEVLQANKAAKEDAFQESIKLKHQFRALNDDEIDFLDSHADAKRAKEEAIRQETSEQLKLFREKQEAANKLATGSVADDGGIQDENTDVVNVDWSMSKKRKRVKEAVTGKGSKVRRGSSDMPSKDDASSGEPSTIKDSKSGKASLSPRELHNPPAPKTSTVQKPNLGLVGYGSDDESD